VMLLDDRQPPPLAQRRFVVRIDQLQRAPSSTPTATVADPDSRRTRRKRSGAS
jgi:hypothetical protein